MRGARLRAALGTAAFLVAAPGVVAGLVPWWLTGWEGDAPLALAAPGWLLIAAGAAFVLHAFARFVVEGVGTPAPVAPTEHLVVGGVYRHVRNPMYLAVGATIAGQALVLGSSVLALYAVVFFAVVAAFVRLYEEPTLLDRYGAEYATYRAAVPGWLPRRRRARP